MGDARGINDPGQFQFHAPGLEPIDQANAASEHDRHQGDCQLVEEGGP